MGDFSLLEGNALSSLPSVFNQHSSINIRLLRHDKMQASNVKNEKHK